MEFNRDARIDTSQIDDVRSSGGRSGGGGFGGGFGFPGGKINIPVGRGSMGCLSIIGIVVFLALQFFTSGSGSSGGSNGQGVNTEYLSGDGTAQQSEIETCNDDPNAVDRPDCRLALIINSVNAFWTQYLPQATPQNVEYRPAVTQLFSQGTTTGCGQATSAVGPFYCPSDEKVYIDMTFFDEMLAQLGADNVPFVQAYVVAHEYGHHIQNILGILQQGQQMDQSGPNSGAVRIELMADCLAGVWTHHATGTTSPDGVKIITSITNEDIEAGLEAAQAIGDDHIQEQAQGRVNPESFTHGTSEQRYKWFKRGIDTGELAQCDTFSGDI